MLERHPKIDIGKYCGVGGLMVDIVVRGLKIISALIHSSRGVGDQEMDIFEGETGFDYGREHGGVTHDEILNLIKRFPVHSYAYKAGHCSMHYIDLFPHHDPLIRCHQFVEFTFSSHGEDLTPQANTFRRKSFPIYVDFFDDPPLYHGKGDSS